MMKIKHESDYPPQVLEYIKQRFYYSPITGNIWIRCKKYSKIAFLQSSRGHFYLRIILNKKIYRIYVHRLAWFLYYGTFPLQIIDHINNDPKDNRILNLRDISLQLNSRRAIYIKCPHCGNNINDDLKV